MSDNGDCYSRENAITDEDLTQFIRLYSWQNVDRLWSIDENVKTLYGIKDKVHSMFTRKSTTPKNNRIDSNRLPLQTTTMQNCLVKTITIDDEEDEKVKDDAEVKKRMKKKKKQQQQQLVDTPTMAGSSIRLSSGMAPNSSIAKQQLQKKLKMDRMQKTIKRSMSKSTTNSSKLRNECKQKSIAEYCEKKSTKNNRLSSTRKHEIENDKNQVISGNLANESALNQSISSVYSDDDDFVKKTESVASNFDRLINKLESYLKKNELKWYKATIAIAVSQLKRHEIESVQNATIRKALIDRYDSELEKKQM